MEREVIYSRDIRADAREIMKEIGTGKIIGYNIGIIGVAFIVNLFISVLMFILGPISVILTLIVAMLFNIVVMRMFVDITLNENLEISSLKVNLNVLLRFLGLVGIAILGCLVIFFILRISGYLIFILAPIIYVLMIVLAVFVYPINILLVCNYSLKDSFLIAIKCFKGRKWGLIKLVLTFFGWFLLSMITCGILGIWLMPYIIISIIHYSITVFEENNIELFLD